MIIPQGTIVTVENHKQCSELQILQREQSSALVTLLQQLYAFS